MPLFRCRMFLFASRLDETLILAKKIGRCRMTFWQNGVVKTLTKLDFEICISSRRNAHFQLFLQKIKKQSGFEWSEAWRCERCCYKVDIFDFSKIAFFSDLFFRRLAPEAFKKWFWSSEKVGPGRQKWMQKQWKSKKINENQCNSMKI